MPSTNSFSIDLFLDYLKFQRRYSQHTLLAYETDLAGFRSYMKDVYDAPSVEAISPMMIRSWLASLKEKGISSQSINRKISSLKSYFKYQLRMAKITISPMISIVSLKVKKRLPSYIEEKEIKDLLQHVEFPDTWDGKTDRLLLLIFYSTGMRLSEVVNLKTCQLDRSNSNIKVLGKGNKERIIPVNNELLTGLFDYLNNKGSILNANQDYLFISAKGNPLYPRHVYNVVKKYLSTVSTNDRKSPHILRHSFATHLTNNGADINAVKELLGHSSLASTQVYTHNSIEKLKNVHRKAHPKA